MSETLDPDPVSDAGPSAPIVPVVKGQSSGCLDRLIGRLLGWPSTLLLALWGLGMLASWAPSYLTWPWFADQDHFAMVAQSWSRGKLPYRDVATNQFPGEIYLFRALGEWTGWGNTVAFYAVDLTMVIGFGALSIAWSVRRFGRILPGLIGFDVFLAYYSSRNFDVAGQRDWHAAFLTIAGFFALGLVRGRPGRVLSGLAVGVAMSIRPQVILFVPGMLLALEAHAREVGCRWRSIVLGWAEWCLAAGLVLLTAFLPLISEGLLPDLLQNLVETDYGAGFTPSFEERIGRLFANKHWKLKIAIMLMILIGATFRGRKPAWTLTLSIVTLQLSALLYGMLSPMNHAYYQIPVVAHFSLMMVYLSGLILEGPSPSPVKSSFLCFLVGMTLADGGRATVPEKSPGAWESTTDFLHGQTPDLQPMGRFEPSQRYPWSDYRGAIEYLRRSTTKETPVANLLVECITAVNGAIPRPTPLPYDGIGVCSFPSWLGRDLEAMKSTPGCVVVWDPTLTNPNRRPGLSERWPKITSLLEVVRERYHFEARFGCIEVWRRNDDPAAGKAP